VSLPEQRDAIQRYATRANLTITDWFEERQTAAKKGRPVWAQMLKALRSGKAKGVVIHKIDRSARNLKDWADLGELIDQGIEVHFANESLDLHSRGGRLSADIQAVVAADYIRNLREEAKKGIYGRLKQGFYPLPAPLGYLDNGAGKAKTIDPQKGPLVKKAFELYTQGTFSLITLREKLHDLGLRSKDGTKVSVSALAKLLRNPFYVGLIHVKRTGQMFQGNQAPLVTKHTFDRVQEIMSGKFHTRSIRHEFLFRRLITCRECEYTLVGETQKSHVYYRCHTRDCPAKSIREEIVHAAVAQRLKALQFTKAEKKYLASAIRELKARWIIDRGQSMKNLEIRREQLTERLNRLTDAYLESAIERDLFEERKAGLLAERQAVQGNLNALATNETSIPETLENFLELAGSLYLLYQTASIEKKRRMVEKVSSNLMVGLETVDFAMKKPFSDLASREKSVDGGPPSAIARTWKNFLSSITVFVTKEPDLMKDFIELLASS
jgi:site-specific DNA recombinase